MLEAIILQMAGGPLESIGFLDALRWWAIGGYTPTGLNDIGLTTRLRSGQSTLARRMFDHAKSTGRLSHAFSTAIAAVEERGGVVEVKPRGGGGNGWQARKVVCTVPLNVLRDVAFTPALSELKAEAVGIGQANRGNKVHADVAGPELVSYTAFASPGKGLVCAIADKETPGGDSHVVFFGPTADAPNGMGLGRDVDAVGEAVRHVIPQGKEVKRIVSLLYAGINVAGTDVVCCRSTTIGRRMSSRRGRGATSSRALRRSTSPSCRNPTAVCILLVRIGRMGGVGGLMERCSRARRRRLRSMLLSTVLHLHACSSGVSAHHSLIVCFSTSIHSA